LSALSDLSESLAAAAERGGAATVIVDARRRFPASGIAWSSDVVVTASHVVERDDNIAVVLPDGRRVEATLAGRDPGSDVAVLRLPEPSLQPATRETGGPLRVGSIVLAIGRSPSNGHMASMGVVSSVGAPWRTFRGTTVKGYIRADVTMYPGFSGGPLVDVSGSVVGMNSSVLGRGGGLAIPMTALDAVVGDLLAAGHVRRGYLGVSTQAIRLPDAFAEATGTGQEAGLMVVSIEPGGPADQGGVLVGDVLVGLDDQTIASTDDLQAQLGGERIGSAVRVRVLRAGAPATLAVTLGERA